MRKLRNTELNRKTIEEFKKSKKTSAIVILDNIRSIHNVGSIFRTSDSFLIEKIIISGYTATPENSKMEKTALGSSDSVDWEYTEDVIETIKNLKNNGIKVVLSISTSGFKIFSNYLVKIAKFFVIKCKTIFVVCLCFFSIVK